VVKCVNVPDEILIPEKLWADKNEFRSAALRLAELFKHNFKQFASAVTSEVLAARPQ